MNGPHDPSPESPPEITDLASACVRYVHDAMGFTLDYTAETLPVLDHYLQAQARGAKAEVADLIAIASGAYFGEVVRRRLEGARWATDAEPGLDTSADPRGTRLEFEPFFLCFNPMGAAMEAIAGETLEGWNAHFQVLDEARQEVARSLEAAAEVAPEDFCTLSMRLETLEQVADVLFGLEAKQPRRRSFGPEIYRVAAGAKVPSAAPS